MILLGSFWGDEQEFKAMCDECDEEYQEISEDIQSFMIGLQSYGWTVRWHKSDCNHYCRKCSERYYENT